MRKRSIIELDILGGKDNYRSTNAVEVKTAKQSRWFLNFGKPLSKILDKLLEKNLIELLPLKTPHPNSNPILNCKYHQCIGHDTD